MWSVLVLEVCDTGVAVCYVKWQGLYRSNFIIGLPTFWRTCLGRRSWLTDESVGTVTSSIVDQNVHPSKVTLHPFEGFLHIIFICDVTFDGVQLGWRRLQILRQLLNISVQWSRIYSRVSQEIKITVHDLGYTATHFTQWIRVFRDQLIINQLISKFTRLHRFSCAPHHTGSTVQEWLAE